MTSTDNDELTVKTLSRNEYSEKAEIALYGRPTAEELLVAAREFLSAEVMPATQGRVQFHTRVTIRVLDTVIRQLQLGEEHLAQHADRLRAIGFADDWELASAIRAGNFDDNIAEMSRLLEPDIRAKLEVADPRYLHTDN